eukprot:4035831-Pyramimonas_sp.AAC.1
MDVLPHPHCTHFQRSVVLPPFLPLPPPLPPWGCTMCQGGTTPCQRWSPWPLPPPLPCRHGAT